MRAPEPNAVGVVTADAAALSAAFTTAGSAPAAAVLSPAPRGAEPFADRRAEQLDLVVELAHDLRSPLTSIIFLADTLGRGGSGEVNPLQRRQLGIVYSAALNLVSMLTDVIELARGGDRLTDGEPVAFSIGEVLESVREMVEPMVAEKGITMRTAAPGRDRWIGHPVALSRVLLNLTANAIDVTDDGFVELAVRETAGGLEFSVRDTGPGMDAEGIEAMFEPLKIRSSRSRYGFSQTGLGLSICRRLLTAIGSELRVESERGRGTRFHFALDLPREEVAPA